MSVIDVCIIGAGTLGSSTAFYVTELNSDKTVYLVGPDGDIQDRNSRDIFGCHYDEGRITRTTDPDPIWAEFAIRSIRHYRDLEKRTGITFYNENGNLTYGPSESHYIRNVKETANRHGIQFQILNSAEVLQLYPYIHIKYGYEAILIRNGGGHISIRNQIRAHQAAAVKNGCHLIRDIATDIFKTYSNSIGEHHCVVLKSGDRILAKSVLLATGAFTNFNNLLPRGLQPDLRLTTETVLKMELSPEDASKMMTMPSMISFIGENSPLDCYILPPIRYPDGKYYIKIGHGPYFNYDLKTNHAITAWYRGDSEKKVKDCLYSTMMDTIKGLKPISIKPDVCVTSRSPTHHLYCDMISDGFGILLGGNGYAAKSANEIGHMAAKMILNGTWDYHIPATKFRARFKYVTSKL